MIENPQIFKILDKEIISFNDENYLVLIENDVFYRVNYKAKLLGVLKGNLILLVKGKFIISVDFSSFSLNRVLYKGTIDSYAASDSSVWFLQNNIVSQIDLERQVMQYDDFSHTQVLKIFYLQGLETLVFIVKNDSGVKVHFENSILPSLNFADISAIPDISFESKYGVILSIGRSVIEYNIQNKQLRNLETPNPITLKWNTNSIRLDYKITSTDITIIDQESKTYTIDSDVWKIINTGQAIYLFSDSINAPLCVNKIDRYGKFFEVYNLKTCNYLIELKKHEHVKSSLYLKFFSSTCVLSSSAIFFIHGGPHQKAGNLWDPLIATLLQKNILFMCLNTQELLVLKKSTLPTMASMTSKILLFNMMR